MSDHAWPFSIVESLLNDLRRRGILEPDLQACADALAVVLDRARRHALLAEATAALHVRADNAERRLRRAATRLAIAVLELHRAGVTEAATVVEVVRKEAVGARQGT
jgi:hypothetical protein